MLRLGSGIYTYQSKGSFHQPGFSRMNFHYPLAFVDVGLSSITSQSVWPGDSLQLRIADFPRFAEDDPVTPICSFSAWAREPSGIAEWQHPRTQMDSGSSALVGSDACWMWLTFVIHRTKAETLKKCSFNRLLSQSHHFQFFHAQNRRPLNTCVQDRHNIPQRVFFNRFVHPYASIMTVAGISLRQIFAPCLCLHGPLVCTL